MKNKFIPWITASILGVLAITFGVLFAITSQNKKELQDYVTAQSDDTYTLKINVDAQDDTKDATFIYEVEGYAKLDEVLLQHPESFSLGPVTQYGRSLNVANGVDLTWTPSNSHFWSVESETYIMHNPSAKGTGTESMSPFSLNVGVSGVIIAQDEIINLVETSFAG